MSIQQWLREKRSTESKNTSTGKACKGGNMKTCKGIQESIDKCFPQPRNMEESCGTCWENAEQDLEEYGLIGIPCMRQAYLLGAKAQRDNIDMPWHENVIRRMQQTKPPLLSPSPTLPPVEVCTAARELAKKVAPVYQLLDWEWLDLSDKLYHIPTEEEIFKKLIQLYEELQALDGNSISTGGLVCSRSTTEGEGIYEFGFCMSEIVT